ncbi:MAG: hypothetical protein ABIG64_09870 [Candidatus Omnitrophota bacterium]
MKNKKDIINSKNSKIRFEIEFYEKLLHNNPDFLDVLVPLAEAYTKAGNYKKGVKLDEHLACLKPEDAIVHYNLACSYSLLGRLEEAFSVLKKAINLGYDDFKYMDQDPDLINLRNDERYSKMISDFVKRKWR